MLNVKHWGCGPQGESVSWTWRKLFCFMSQFCLGKETKLFWTEHKPTDDSRRTFMIHPRKVLNLRKVLFLNFFKPFKTSMILINSCVFYHVCSGKIVRDSTCAEASQCEGCVCVSVCICSPLRAYLSSPLNQTNESCTFSLDLRR